MMTGMERLAAALQGRPCDRIPVFCNLLDQGAKELGIPIRDYYASGEYVAEAQLKMRAKYGFDNLWCLFYVGKEAELLGCRKIIYAPDGPPNVGEMILKNYDDILKLEAPEDLAAQPAFAEPLKCLRLLRREAGGSYPICAYLTASMSLPPILMGMDHWLELLLSGPASVRDELLEKCSVFFKKQLAVYADAGVDVFLYSNPFCSPDFVPMRLIEDLSLPWMSRDLEIGGRSGLVFYCGGARMAPVIERALARFPFDACYPGLLDDIAQCKQLIAGRALCAGVFNDLKLIDWPPERIREEVRRILATGMPGGKFFFGTMLMPYAIPEANIRAMLGAAYEYGRWPMWGE